MAASACMDVVGLGSIWETSPDVRNATREHGLLLLVPPRAAFCEAKRSNATKNSAVLLPCLARLKENPKMPYLDNLQHEIGEYFKLTHVAVTEKLIYRTANELKRLLSFSKRKANRKEVTKVRVAKLFQRFVVLRGLYIQNAY